MTIYICSTCGEQLSSSGVEASDHMYNQHNINPDPDIEIPNDAPYLIPVDSNPTLDEAGIPV